MPKKGNRKGKARGNDTRQKGAVESTASSSQTQLPFEPTKDDTKTHAHSEPASPTSPAVSSTSNPSMKTGPASPTSPAVSSTSSPSMKTGPAIGDSIVHERSKDSPETIELKPVIKQRREESGPQSKIIPNDLQQPDSEECVRTIHAKTMHANEVEDGDIRTYAKDIKVTADETGDSRSRRRKPPKKGKKADEDSYGPTGRRQVQQSIRDMFPVRRSTRKCKTLIETEIFEELGNKLRNKMEDDLEVKEVGDKGKGVFSIRSRKKGDFICEYSGELISYEEARSREEKYAKDVDTGCYMYYFEHRNTKYCVDATVDNGRMGRLLNHSKTQANVVTKMYEVDNHPYLCLVASRDIVPGEELQYDYGERNKDAIEAHPWLTA